MKKRLHPDIWIHPFLMWAIIIAGIVAAFDDFHQTLLYQPSFLLYLLSGLCFIYWMYFFIRGISVNTEASFPASHISRLITSGVYEKVRHPLYSADIVLAWGIFIIYPLSAVCASATWLTIVMVLWAYLEEQSLKKSFGSAYDTYQKHTHAFIPIKRNTYHKTNDTEK